MTLGLLTSVGPTKIDRSEVFSVKEKIHLTNQTIFKKGACLWGVNFLVNKSNLIERVGAFPIDIFFYVTADALANSGKVAYRSKLVDVDSNNLEHISKESELRPDVWMNLKHRTYFKLSEEVKELSNPKLINEYKNDKGVYLTKYSVRTYTIITF